MFTTPVENHMVKNTMDLFEVLIFTEFPSKSETIFGERFDFFSVTKVQSFED